MKTLRNNKIIAIAALLFTITGCSDSELSESNVKSCILNITGHEDIGVALESKALGITFGSSIINDIRIDNIIPSSEIENIAQVVIELGQKQVNLNEEAAQATANMVGGRVEDGFIVTDIQASYSFIKGSKGWACRELQ